MYRLLIIIFSAAAAFALYLYGRNLRMEVRRLENNCEALADSVVHYRTRLGEEAASTSVLRLRCDEFRRLHAEDAGRIRSMGIRLRRLESTASASLAMQAAAASVIHDTVVVRDTVRMFGWSDGWVSVEGLIAGDSVACSVSSVDTLHQIVHRVPRKFLFIRFGTKAVRQEIVSSNPHTRIVSAEYIEFPKKRRR